MSLATQLGDRETAAVMESHHTYTGWESGRRVGAETPEVTGATDPESVFNIAAVAATTAMFGGTIAQALAASDAAMELSERRRNSGRRSLSRPRIQRTPRRARAPF